MEEAPMHNFKPRDDGTPDARRCRSMKETMRKISYAILFAAVTGALTIYGQNVVKDQDSNSVAQPFTVDETPIDRSNTHQFFSYASMLDTVTPAVVTVATSSVVRVMRNQMDPMQELMRRFYGLPAPENRNAPSNGGAVEEERRVPNGMGSGVIISSNGYILTNNHVISDSSGDAADEITVTLPGGREFTAKLVGRDPQTDVALIKIEAEGLPVLTMADSDNLKVGDVVFAVGNPMGLSQTVTMGIVSALGRSRLGILGDRGYEDFIQTDASINPGNSGGALVDAQGRLVGINTAILSRTGGNIGIGFAIPSTMARSIVSSLVDNGKVDRGYLGVTIRNLDPMLAESFGVESGKGSLIEGVKADSPAELAGLKRGDIIVGVDGKHISSESELRIHVAQKKPGTIIKISYIRDGAKHEADVTLGSLSDSGLIAGVNGESLLEGVSVRPITDELAKQYELSSNDGIVITSVSAESPFSRILAVGMQIIEVNDVPVKSVSQAVKLLKKAAVNRLWITYHGQNGYVAIRVP